MKSRGLGDVYKRQLFSFWHPYDLDVGTFGDVPEAPYIILFLKKFFFLAVLVECLFPPLVLNHRFKSQLLLFHYWFPVDFSLFHLL